MPSRIIRPIVRHGRGFELCKSWVTPKYLAMQLIIGWGQEPAPFGWLWYTHFKTATTFLITHYDHSLVITEQEFLNGNR